MSQTFKFGNKQWYGKKGSVLAYNDENNNFKPLPFDFTRSSSATRVNKDGLIEVVGSDEPRVDYLNNADGHLLLEPSRTNLLSYSDDLDSWGKTNVSVTSNSTVSPDGTQNADTITVITQASVEAVAAGFTADGSSNYTISGYIKKTTTSINIQLKIRDNLASGTTHCFVDFDTLDASVSASIGTYSITSFNDDWWYVTATSTTPPTAGTRKGIVRMDNEVVGTETIVWGLQIEAGSYATSYIPTSGSSVTRAAPLIKDAAVGITDIYPSTELTMYMELDIQPQDRTGTYFRFNLQDSTAADNWIFLGFEQNDKVRFYVRKAATNSVDASSTETYTTEQTLKISARIKSNTDYSVYVNGLEILSGTNALIPTNLSEINLITSTGQAPRDKIKELKLYNTALTDAQLIALTS